MLFMLEEGAAGGGKPHVDRKPGGGDVGPQTLDNDAVVLILMKARVEELPAIASRLRRSRHDDALDDGRPSSKSGLAIPEASPAKRKKDRASLVDASPTAITLGFLAS